MIGAVIIHGMGSQEPGFSKPLAHELASRLGGDSARVVFKEIYWADVLEPRETRLWDAMGTAHDPSGRPVRVDWAWARDFVVHNFGDALAYHRESVRQGGTYADVQARISRALRELKAAVDPGAPLVIFAHSLGCHMMSDYIWDRQQWSGPPADVCEPIDTVTSLVTFGCNIPLFSLDFDSPKPIDLPGPGVRRPALLAASRWLNFLNKNDVLGWPMKPLYLQDPAGLTPRQRQTVDRIEDYEIEVGTIATCWNPGSHMAYWTDEKLIQPAARHLGALLRALDA